MQKIVLQLSGETLGSLEFLFTNLGPDVPSEPVFLDRTEPWQSEGKYLLGLDRKSVAEISMLFRTLSLTWAGQYYGRLRLVELNMRWFEAVNLALQTAARSGSADADPGETSD